MSVSSAAEKGATRVAIGCVRKGWAACDSASMGFPYVAFVHLVSAIARLCPPKCDWGFDAAFRGFRSPRAQRTFAEPPLHAVGTGNSRAVCAYDTSGQLLLGRIGGAP